jgi:hypothetical protein
MRLGNGLQIAFAHRIIPEGRRAVDCIGMDEMSLVRRTVLDRRERPSLGPCAVGLRRWDCTGAMTCCGCGGTSGGAGDHALRQRH